jgi:hypothetical protein
MLRSLQQEFGDDEAPTLRKSALKGSWLDPDDEISLNFDEQNSRQGRQRPQDEFIDDESDIGSA